ncbi:hypothetical protein HRbin36_01405 [bacterium HR36]|nr:hypothetical protein HRbin36_01405 [bacterium HR36]
MKKGVSFLLQRQSRDGGWRSEHCASFANGTALTPLVLLALQQALGRGEASPELHDAIRRGLQFLAGFRTAEGGIAEPEDGFDYPVYTASLTLRVLCHESAQPWASWRAAWANYLLERQLTEKLGWNLSDKPYGGWGYCRVVPRKPAPGQFAPPLVESNLSATVFALDALAAADALEEAVKRKAAVFIRRCQNEDGGFHFIYDDPVRNKAGVANWEPLRFHSYGSATADGLRALMLCQLAEDKARIRSAADWLARHFAVHTHPGRYLATQEPQRNAVYYYYLASLAPCAVCPELSREWDSWRIEIAQALAGAQQSDGHWSNPLSLVREDDPVIATAFAVLVLTHCLR